MAHDDVECIVTEQTFTITQLPAPCYRLEVLLRHVHFCVIAKFLAAQVDRKRLSGDAVLIIGFEAVIEAFEFLVEVRLGLVLLQELHQWV